MGMIQKIFGKKVGKKSGSPNESAIQSLLRVFGKNNGYIMFGNYLDHRLNPKQAYELFEKVSVVFDAVDKISSRASGLNLVMRSVKDRDVLREHPMIKTLMNPGSSMTKTDFWTGLTTSHLLTSEAWIVARGRIERPPLELEFIEAYNVDGDGIDKDLIPSVLKTDSPKDKRRYIKEEIDGVERWISADSLNELIPIISRSYAGGWRGFSRLSPLIEEVTHIREGNKHNRSMLENGMNVSEVFAPESGVEIEEEEGKRLRDMLAEHHQGAGNSGKPLILPLSFKMISRAGNNKDMDYIMLIDTDESRIYRLYNIPLPLVKSQTMTQSNYEVAIPFLYSDAVLPTFSYLAEQITLKLGKRYKLDDYILTYDEFNIPALNESQVKLMAELQKTNSATINEIRSRGGLPEIIDLGEDVMLPANVVRLKDVRGFGDD